MIMLIKIKIIAHYCMAHFPHKIFIISPPFYFFHNFESTKIEAGDGCRLCNYIYIYLLQSRQPSPASI